MIRILAILVSFILLVAACGLGLGLVILFLFWYGIRGLAKLARPTTAPRRR